MCEQSFGGGSPDLADKLAPLDEALTNGTEVSYTQWEAWLALYHEKLLVIAKAADSAERGPRYNPTDASRAAQAAHLERLKGVGHYPGCPFTSTDNLAKSVLSSAILDLLVENVIVQRSGSGADTDIQSGRPYLRLTQYVRRTKLAVRDSSQTALLSAYRADVVPLIGRDAEMASLRQWLAGQEPVSIRVMVGAGGRGKTRLALELAREIAKDGWLAGFVTPDELDRFRSQGGVERWRWDKPALAIVDYAASRAEQMRAWLRELVDASFDTKPKLRLLLLERQANRSIGWLSTVFGRGDNEDSRAAIALLDPKEPVEVAALSELAFRHKVFATLLQKANPALDAPPPGVDAEFDRRLADDKWAGDPLYLMMAGLAAAREGVQAALGLSRADLALSTGRNELERIGRIGAARGVDEKQAYPGAFVRHMAVLATLAQGLTLPEARELAARERDRLGSSAPLDATIQALADALPASGGGAAPILPDVVGEGAILAWFGADGGVASAGVKPEASIANAARMALGKVSATLMRAAQDFAAAGYTEPIRWLEGLAGAREGDLGALIEIADALLNYTLYLRVLAAELTDRIVRLLRQSGAAGTGESPVELRSLYTTWLNNLGNRLSALGRCEDALAAAQEAVDIRRRLAAERPDAFRPDLAMSLNNLGNRMSDLGRREDALAAAQEAVVTLSPLFLRLPQAYAQRMSVVARQYLERCESSGAEPDTLLDPIVEAFQKLEAASDADPSTTA
jgi:Tetratricopeptide repeat